MSDREQLRERLVQLAAYKDNAIAWAYQRDLIDDEELFALADAILSEIEAAGWVLMEREQYNAWKAIVSEQLAADIAALKAHPLYGMRVGKVVDPE